MGLFDIFKKKEEPKTDLTPWDLEKGYIFERDMVSWEVKSVANYDWGGGSSAREFEVTDGSSTQFLYAGQGNNLSVSWEIDLLPALADVKDHIVRTDDAPRQINYNGSEWLISEESAGQYQEDGAKGWDRFVSYVFKQTGGDGILTINRWDEHSFDAYEGIEIKAHQIHNILPR